ncbi:hydantoinase B/oxoprolinase family protein [Acuticoccus mangrovi]|uniref:Hydantoinase B/oxoprolinase family protein n=1 Tax=Acuticoccus mangrovi TaxID=2796142 RepID=A0A934IMI9_9HYPH|nr:hydantoinase B/oxoprolinase family protein [Acuticoccus mangrovi]MBJ3774144.1 hydantoinase B/oxoprolinase family protein [Acuticoccus mangrovi]
MSEDILPPDALMRRDPVTFEIVRNSLYAICEEMRDVLMRTSFSPLLSLSADLSCAILDACGEVAAQGNDIPVHLGAMPFTGRAVLEAFPRETWREGDGVLLNDPYLGGTHLPDMSLLLPVFVDGALIGFTATRVHWPDVGGIAAGSSSIADEIIKEGLRIPPLKLIEGGTVRQDVLNLILANVRVPGDRLGDFRAQHAANLRGVQRLAGLGRRYGRAVTEAVLSESQAHSHLKVRHRLAALPDATVEAAETLDGDGFGTTDTTVRVRIEKRGADFRVDFSATSPAVRGPINAPLPVTASSVYYVLMGLAGGDILPNSGAYAAAEVTAPEGSLVNAAYPRPVVAANTETSNRIVDTLLAALAKAYPDRVPAGSYGSACVYTLGGDDPRSGRRFVHYETIGGGMGARRGAAGVAGMRVHMGNTMNLPIEAMEAQLPLRFHAYEVVREAGGAGRWRGGGGVRKVVEMLADGVAASVLGERTASAAAGVAGGRPGGLARFVVHRRGVASETLGAKSGPHSLSRGDRLEMVTAGGGGWGEPTSETAAAPTHQGDAP